MKNIHFGYKYPVALLDLAWNNQRTIALGAEMEDVVMGTPGCGVRCNPCGIACASLPARIELWADRLNQIDENIKTEPENEALRDRLNIALAVHKGLLQQYEATPQAEAQRAFLGLPSES